MNRVSEDIVGLNLDRGDTLFIYFSSFQWDWDVSAGPTRFDFINTAIRTEQPSYLVRDRQNLWYHLGVAGAEGSSSAIVDLMSSHARRYQRVVCIGSSMGGYAALLFGERLGADLAVGIVPQVRIGEIATRGMGETRFEERFAVLDRTTPTPDLLRLDEVLTARATNTHYVAICGANGWIDVQHLDLLKDVPRCERVLIDQASHNEAALYCLKNNFLTQFLNGNYLRTAQLSGIPLQII